MTSNNPNNVDAWQILNVKNFFHEFIIYYLYIVSRLKNLIPTNKLSLSHDLIDCWKKKKEITENETYF